MTTGSVAKNIVYFSLPYFFSYFLQTLYGMADLFIIGQFEGAASITAVSIGSQVMHMLTVMIVGLAMGTSEAVGYVNAESSLLGWFSELAFAPVDLNERAMRDEWSGDRGVGCKYFSQDAVAKLAPAAGIALSERLTPAEKLKEVQKLAEQGLPYALEIFKSIGVYLGHTLCLYERLYDIRSLIVLGRVASGVGGELIVAECRRVLKEEYPELAQKLCVMLPDEKFRRVGQSMAAASLPEISPCRSARG